MPEAHALLSASSSARWLHCPPSIRLCEQFPDTTSSYAAAGTLAHAIAELKARKYFLEPMGPQDFQARLKVFKDDPLYTRDMDENTNIYLEHLKALSMAYPLSPFVALEVQVDYSRYAPEAFGTADCIMIGGDRLCVVDYKNGAGVAVEAEENSQMKLYALGALETYRMIYGDSIKTVHLSIVQPNAGGVKEWETNVEALRAWGESVVKPAALLAWNGQGDFCPGPWCDKTFCRARSRCAARAKMFFAVEARKGAVPLGFENGTAKQKKAFQAVQGQEGLLLTDEELGDVLSRAEGLASWIKDLREYALSSILKGGTIPGYKAVNGKTSREWMGGPDKAFAALMQRGVDEALLWNREPVTVPALETTLGKKVFAETAKDLWEKKPGAPTLAPESDRRKAYVPAEAVFKPVDGADGQGETAGTATGENATQGEDAPSKS